MNTFIVAVSTFAIAASAAPRTKASTGGGLSARREWDGMTGYTYANQQDWGGMCKSGNEQSPIDIVNSSVELGQAASVSLKYYDQTVGNDIKSQRVTSGFRVLFTRGSLKFVNWLDKEQEFTPLAVMFKSPAEHTVNGVRHPVEVQVHHKYEGTHNALGASMSFFLSTTGERNPAQKGGDNDFVKECLSATPDSLGKTISSFNPATAFGAMDISKFWMYDGSMTNPPCSEGIKWIINEQVGFISQSQIDLVKKYISDGTRNNTGNARAIQPLGERRIWQQNDMGAITASVGLVSLIALNALF